MPPSPSQIGVYLEIGTRRVIAGACDWPGWCRSARDELAALQALSDYAPRYVRVLRGTGLGFPSPEDATAFSVVERLKGNATTDFGTPGMAPSCDRQPVSDAELERQRTLLKACWRAFDKAVQGGEGKTLRLGPRGGGRNLQKIVDHVLEAELAYLAQLGIKLTLDTGIDVGEQIAAVRKAIVAGLGASARGELPVRGPRGGLRWGPRYMTRRVAWHVLDHTWEVEDRIQ